MSLPNNIQNEVAKLKTTDEYGTVFTDPHAKASPELLAYFKEKHGIRTDVHRMCQNCQILQITKYADFKTTSETTYDTTKFLPRCSFVLDGLPAGVGVEEVERIATQNDITFERAKRVVLAAFDPVAWCELMFGFDDKTPDWHLRAHQKEMLRCSTLRLCARWGRRSGKALALDTPIPTPQGWTTMGDLKEGDQVFDEKGKPCNVTFVTEVQRDRKCYAVSFNDGSTIIADADHQWSVETKFTRKNNARNKQRGSPKRHRLITLTTKDMLLTVKIGSKQESNYSIPVAGSLRYAEQLPLPIDPYVLGYWLGDGVRNTGRITIGEQDIAESSQNIKSAGYQMRIGGHSPIDHNVFGLTTQLRELGVRDRKHIPEVYLRASVEDRLELLKGLMDSDGSVDEGGKAEFTASDEALAGQVFELIVGLGMKASLSRGESWFNGIQYKDRHRIYFVPAKQVFRLTRKAERVRTEPEPQTLRRYIVSIEPVESVPVKCITVDSPNSLYLAGRSCVPTHNTFCLALKLLYSCFEMKITKGSDATGKPVISGPQIMVITPYQTQLSNFFDELEKLIKRNPGLVERIKTNSRSALYTKNPYTMEFDTGAIIEGFVSGVGTKQDGSGGGTMRGSSADIIYLDEMDMIPGEILEKVVRPILMTRSGVRMFATSTPIGQRGSFYEWCLSRPDFKETYYPTTVLPHWEEVKQEVVGETTQEGFKAEYLAEFIDGGSGVFKASLVHHARSDYQYNDTESYQMWKRLGIERSELIKSIGIDWNLNAGTEFYVMAYHPQTGMHIGLEAVNIEQSQFSGALWRQEVKRLNYKWKPDFIYADEGYGHTIIEDLLLESLEVGRKHHKTPMDLETAQLTNRLKSYNFSSKVELRNPVDHKQISKPSKFFLVETAIRVFEANRIMFPESDNTLVKQLTSYVKLRESETTGKPVYGPESRTIGDHRLDAFMLALASVYLENGVHSRGSFAPSEPGVVSMRKNYQDTYIDPKVAGEILRREAGVVSVLSLIRGSGSNPQDDKLIKQKYAAEEALRGKPSRKRGDIGRGSPQAEQQVPASAYAKDEEDLYRMSGSVAVRKTARKPRGFTRR